MSITLGVNDVVFLGSGNSDLVGVGPNSGTETLKLFQHNDIVDLIGNAGGYASASSALAALTPDGHGGALLSLGGGNSIDIAGLATTNLSSANFKIG
jgi:hypothetical protein